MKKYILVLLIIAFPAHAFEVWNGIGKNGKARWSQTTVQVNEAGEIVAPNNDAATRSRISSPYGVFQDKRLYDKGETEEWNEYIVGAGSSTAFLANESAVTLTVGTNSGDRVTRESRYLAYIPGRSMLIKMTGVMGSAPVNVVKRIGYFSDKNGLFFQQTSTGTSVCVRTSTSGSPVDTCVAQADWNIDTLSLTGNNPSNITLDITKTQLFVIDFLWQGVGRVRFGLMINGRIVYVHSIDTANVSSTVYMGTPSLPTRYELISTGISAGSTMKQICVSVESEGGYEVPSHGFSASNGITTRAITTESPVIAIRLANTFNGLENRKSLRLKHLSLRAVTNDGFCTIKLAQGVSATVGGAWVAVGTNSATEYNLGITSVTANQFTIIDSLYAISGQGVFSDMTNSDIDMTNAHSILFQNYASTGSTYFVVYCTSFTATSNISAELNWQEFE